MRRLSGARTSRPVTLPLAVGAKSKHIVVGVGGGIAAYKAVHLVRELIRAGAEVRVVMTASATRFVGPLTFSGLTGTPTVTDLWDDSRPGEVHVELGAWADAMIVAPATMNLLGRAAAGLADDAVLATVACMDGPVFFAPAMHHRMWKRSSTQRSVRQLEADGVVIVGPEDGELASGEHGPGRMSEPDVIAERVLSSMTSSDLTGMDLLVTAGPTIEDLDPVRFLGNRSTGRMGFAVAAQARRRGAHVTLVSGPVDLATPRGVDRVDVRSAVEMHQEVLNRSDSVDAVVMAAAVADYRPEESAAEKIKKGDDSLSLRLVRNPDILAELGARRKNGNHPMLIGFAVETNDLISRAQEKLRRKRCDVVVANLARDGFGGAHNQATIVSVDSADPLPPLSKAELADRILDRLASLSDARKTRRPPGP